jgi:hypothetical protein
LGNEFSLVSSGKLFFGSEWLDEVKRGIEFVQKDGVERQLLFEQGLLTEIMSEEFDGPSKDRTRRVERDLLALPTSFSLYNNHPSHLS